MNIDVELIEKVVKKVLNDVETGSSESEYGYGIFDTMDEAIEASAKAQKEYMKTDEYVEEAAREKLGLVKDNEIVFQEEK